MTTPPPAAPPIYTPFDRDEVTRNLGPAWPAPPTAALLTLPPDALDTNGNPFATGAVAVFPVPGRPGRTWWAVDSQIPPQQAGTPDDALAAMLPGSVLQTPPPPADSQIPPQT